MRMSRVNVYLPGPMYRKAKRARLNVSQLCQEAVDAELRRQARLRALEQFTTDVAEKFGSATPDEIADAEAWVDDVLRAAQPARRPPRRAGAARARKSA
jgi:post-segregation antitoxin (ccd killing protein)